MRVLNDLDMGGNRIRNCPDVGIPGETPDIQIGTVETLPPDQDATVELAEDSTKERPILDIGIPTGYTPNIGPDGNWWIAGTDTNVNSLGTDGNPIGTIISFMGRTAPNGYLICDGSTLNIADFPALATFFSGPNQFGASNCFGGDGVTTFALPDLRNLFLRGYHGDAAEQLSGDVGERQEATETPISIFNDTSERNGKFYFAADASPSVLCNTKNMDSLKYTGTPSGYSINGSTGGIDMASWGYSSAIRYTSRPVNTAVLYCIKYI